MDLTIRLQHNADKMDRLISLVFKNMNNGEILIPGAQGIGFMALAVCIFSPLSLLNKNSSEQASK